MILCLILNPYLIPFMLWRYQSSLANNVNAVIQTKCTLLAVQWQDIFF